MRIKELREINETRPFHPFVLHLADGRAVPVKHPEFLASAPSGRMIVVFQPDDSLNIIDLMLVTDIEMNPAHSAPDRKRS